MMSYMHNQENARQSPGPDLLNFPFFLGRGQGAFNWGHPQHNYSKVEQPKLIRVVQGGAHTILFVGSIKNE